MSIILNYKVNSFLIKLIWIITIFVDFYFYLTFFENSKQGCFEIDIYKILINIFVLHVHWLDYMYIDYTTFRIWLLKTLNVKMKLLFWIKCIYVRNCF